MTATATAIRPRPRADVLADGFRTPPERFPESDAIVAGHRDETSRTPSPRDGLQRWFGDDIARTQARIERAGRIERRMRERSAFRAEFFWDEDRRILAEDLGERLPRNPARVIKTMQATPQGCDWIIGRWHLLLEILHHGQAWNDKQAALALDLLGTPTDLREDAAVARLLADPAGVARAEIRKLEERKAQVAASDEYDRAMAMANLADPATPEFRELRRHEASLLRRMKWAMEVLALIPEPVGPRPEAAESRPLPTPPIPTAGPEPEPLPHPSATVPSLAISAIPRSHRPDPKKLRARADRLRRQDRPDR